MSEERPARNAASHRHPGGTADKKRFNLELFLPLGGMIIVGITSLVLGWLFSTPPKRENEPMVLPPLEEYERARLRAQDPSLERDQERPATERALPPDLLDAGPIDAGPGED